jgi:hypothetical protein
MKDRIQVDGVWYIKEPTPEPQPIKLEVVDYIGCAVENDYFAFDATISPFPSKDINIKVTDKRSKGKDESWDWHYLSWMNGVLEGTPASLEALVKDDWGQDNIKYLQAFLQHLKEEKHWL